MTSDPAQRLTMSVCVCVNGGGIRVNERDQVSDYRVNSVLILHHRDQNTIKLQVHHIELVS